MAKFYGQPCPLCGIKMTDDDRLFGTTAFLEPDSDLYVYSDDVMHWDCYSKWEHRTRFAQMYFDSKMEEIRYNTLWRVAYSDNQVLVQTNNHKLIREVHVTLAETGSTLSIPLGDWEDWLSGEWHKSCAHECERDALAVIIPLLKSKLPIIRDP